MGNAHDEIVRICWESRHFFRSLASPCPEPDLEMRALAQSARRFRAAVPSIDERRLAAMMPERGESALTDSVPGRHYGLREARTCWHAGHRQNA